MKKLQLIFSFLILGAVAYTIYFFVKDGQLRWEGWGKLFVSSDTRPREPEIIIPEGGVKSNTLSLELMRLLVQEKTHLNPSFSPLGTGMILEQLHEMLPEAQASLIKSLLEKNGKQAPLSTPAIGMSSLVIDESLPRAEGEFAANLPRLLLTREKTEAIMTLNEWLTLHSDGLIQSGIKAHQIPDRMSLFAVNAIAQPFRWLHPVEQDVLNDMVFTPRGETLAKKVSCLSTSAPLRFIDSVDFIAVAQFFQPRIPQGNPTCLLLIMPKHEDIRRFVEEMSPEKLSTIRAALAQTEPRFCYLRFPLFTLPTVARSQNALFAQLGLQDLLTTPQNLPKLSTEPSQLSHVWEICAFNLIAAEEAVTQVAPEDMQGSPTSINIEKPFFWMVGDLSSDTPPSFMGLVEYL